MRQWKLWMMAAILTCGFVTTSCDDALSVLDNPAQPETEVIPKHEIDNGEFQPSDINVALLGSLSSSADDQVVKYWFKNVLSSVTEKTQLVITDKLTDAYVEDIMNVLGRYGTVLIVDPDEQNVREYAEKLGGADPNANYKNLELIGLTGFGDQFISYKDENEESSESAAPASIALDEIWNVAPNEYLRMKAFAQWVEQVDQKYTEYQKYLEEISADVDDDEILTARGGTRKSGGQAPGVDLTKIPKIYRCINVTAYRWYESYVQASTLLYPTDHDGCNFSATCNYRIIPMYQYPVSAADQGGDYYLVDAMLSWDCSVTDKGYDKFKHVTDRDSYRFFPLKCTLYTTPKPTKSEYSVVVDPIYSLWPQNAVHNTDIQEHRGFNLEGNVSAGAGIEDGEFSGQVDANVGFGAEYSKDQQYTVEEINISQYTSGSSVGHIFTVPDDYHPIKESGHTPTIYVPKPVNFSKTLSTPESWLWKVNGTKMDTKDSAIKLEFTVKPKVAWYSYFLAAESLDRRTYEDVTMTGTADVPAPYRMNVGYIQIKPTTVVDGNNLHLFEVQITDVTDPNKPKKFPVIKKTVKFGEIFTTALVADREYKFEVKLGNKRNKTKVYTLDKWKVEGKFHSELLETDIDFDDPK